MLRNNLKKQDLEKELSLSNFYALEILDSMGVDAPSQEQIDKVEECVIKLLYSIS